MIYLDLAGIGILRHLAAGHFVRYILDGFSRTNYGAQDLCEVTLFLRRQFLPALRQRKDRKRVGRANMSDKKICRVLLGTTALVFGAGLMNPVLAQGASDGDGFLGTIVLGEGKRKVQTNTAVPETKIDRNEINDRQAGTIAELIDSVPGVTLVNGSTPQGSGISIRGFGANGVYGTDQKVAILVDGASVGAEELYRIGTQLFTDPALYRAVSVIRGTVGSFEYGSGIVGGVVKLETINASDLTGGEKGFKFRQSLQYSSNGNGLSSSTILAWQPTENLGFLANYTLSKQDNQVDGSGTEIGASAFNLPSYLIKAHYSFGEAKDQTLTFSFSDSNTSETDVPYDTFQTTGGSFGNVDRNVFSRTAALTYTYKPEDNDLIDLEVVLSYADQKIDQEYVAGSSVCEVINCGFPFPAGGFSVVNADHRYQTTKLTAKNKFRFNTGAIDHNLLFGLEFIRKERLDASSAPGGVDNRWAVFAINEMEFGDRLTITPALRYEASHIQGSTAPNNGSFKNEALMGGVSARYAFDSGFAVFASAAYTENLPIIDDLGNATLMTQSEKSVTYELGASYESKGVFTAEDTFAIKANLYKTRLWDITSYSGVSSTDTQGIELEASYALNSGFYVDLNANLTDGAEYDTLGARADWDGLPADSLQLTLGKKFDDQLDVSWEMVAAKGRTVNGTSTAGYAVHNLRVSYQPDYGVFQGTEIRLGVENVFDRDYRPRLSTRQAPGRNIKLTLAKTF